MMNIGNIDYLFFRAWRNIIIRNEILYHTRICNIHLNKKFIINPDQLLEYKYKGYIDKLVLVEKKEIGDEENKRMYNEITILPSSLQYYEFNYNIKDIFNITSLQHLHSLTSLSLLGAFNESLDGQWIPKNIKSLEFGREFQHPIKVCHLLNNQSLTRLILQNNYNGIIEYGAIPITITNTNLNYRVDCRNQLFKIPASTTRLMYNNHSVKVIKHGDISHNVTSLEFSNSFDCEIIPYSLPHSIRTIIFYNNYNSIIKDGTLPPNLTHLIFGFDFNQELTSSMIPLSITSIEFKDNYTFPIKHHLFSNHLNLKSLKFK